MSLIYALHVLFAVLWVGGMFFTWACLRPAAGALDAPVRASLWAAVLSRFFAVVLIAVPVMLASGLWLVMQYGGFAVVRPHIHIMFGLGILMMLLFFHVFFAPFKRLKRAVAAGDSALAVRQLGQLRTLVGINLLLGLIVVVVASAGRLGAGA